jgi:hypothetical protein
MAFGWRAGPGKPRHGPSGSEGRVTCHDRVDRDNGRETQADAHLSGDVKPASGDSSMKWPSWLKLARQRKPRSPTACPGCGKQMVFVEKYTMSGDDLRAYRCDQCQEEHTICFGIAMWKLMSDANQADSEK